MTILSFGKRTTILANRSLYLPGTGGTDQAAEITLVIPQDGTLKNLHWDSQSNGLTGTGNKFTIRVGGLHATPTSSAPALTDALVVSIDGKTNGTQPFNYAVLAGQRVGVEVKTVTGGTSISRLRVSFELEPTVSGGGSSEIFEAGGKVGIGTSTPQEKLTLAPDSDFAIEMPIVSGVTTALQSSGSLPADDYFLMISASDGIGWTKATNEIPVTLSASDHSVKIDWNSIPGAVRYRVYRALVSGGPYKYIETPYNTYEYSGDGDFNDSGTPPAVTTAYFNKLSASGPSWLKGGNVGIGTANPQEKLTISQESDLAVEMTVPTLLSATAVDGGALPPDIYYFKIVVEDGAGGKTIASNELSCTIVAGSPKRSCQLEWTAVQGVKSYLVYIGDDVPGGQDRCYRVDTNSHLYIGETTPLPWEPISSVTTAYINKLSAAGDSWLLGGNIGIGTTNPAANLHVAGTFYAPGSVVQVVTSVLTTDLGPGANNAWSANLVTLTITPKFANSKIIVRLCTHLGLAKINPEDPHSAGYVRIMVGTTKVAGAGIWFGNENPPYRIIPISLVGEFSPGITNPVTFGIQLQQRNNGYSPTVANLINTGEYGPSMFMADEIAQ